MSQSEEVIFSKIIDFIQKIGIPFEICEINQEMFLPGLRIENGVLQIEKEKLTYIGDTLHEAGHIALMTPEERENNSGSLENEVHKAATEMAVIAWTYAACLEIGIEPSVVFHAYGYKGESENIIYNFSNGHYIGVPILQWYGMTNERIDLAQSKTIAYPEMISWLRQ
ncbi:hypothetical protein [Emticicia sp. C21]|uniref:hypothetical protein n=1 Tax=Emticicia sp. C21 TaxID=2302915 RepID=UPI000E3427FD|nr:hypothetical protein [Emticicia sp. C21]RFS15518.1 hypothetical protein D0T08_15320 [Emticicia sp. C21]